VRTGLTALSEQISVPVENIVTPEIVRRICWDWDGNTDVDELLAGHGARPWQRELTAAILTEALAD
jgi:ribonuclease D